MVLLLFALFHGTLALNMTWDLTYTLSAPDGFERRVVGVNGKWPIDPLVLNQEDTLNLMVTNHLSSVATIHSHGLFQNTTNYSDGTFGITECGIPPSGSKLYSIPIKQAGTYWAHGHSSGHYVDGLRTPLILLPANQPFTMDPNDSSHILHASRVSIGGVAYSEEYIVSVSDWYNTEHSVLLAFFASIYNPSGAEPIPNSGLINHSLNTKFKFSPGSTYLLRLVNVGAFTTFNFWIDAHNLTIVEVDGVSVQPFSVPVLPIAVAQRYSFLVTAKNDAKFNYQMHALMNDAMLDSIPPELNLMTNGTIVYDSNAPLFVSTEDPPTLDGFIELDLTPVPVISAFKKPTASYPLSVDFQLYTDGINHGAFNEKPLGPYTPVPPMLSALTTGDLAMNPATYGPASNAIVADHLDTVEFIISNLDSNAHPFHLHGHVFQVLAISSDTLTPTQDVMNSLDSLVNPVRRDTIIVPSGGYVVLRFVADNPGVWFFHCHIEWHLEVGLALVLIEAPKQMQQTIHPPQVLLDQCLATGKKISGNAAGVNDTVSFMGINGFVQPWPLGFTPKAIGALACCIFSALLGLGTILYFTEPPKKE